MKVTFELQPLEVSECAMCFGFPAFFAVYLLDKMKNMIEPVSPLSATVHEAIEYYFDHDLEANTLDEVKLKSGKVLTNISPYDVLDHLTKCDDLTPYIKSDEQTVWPLMRWYATQIESGRISVDLL
jgi:hypothetical protein